MFPKDFELSKRFYVVLGFSMSEGWGGTADFSLDGHTFRLQDFYVKDWAENFMFVMDVDDVSAWYRHAQEMFDSGAFPGMRVKAPEPVDGATVMHIFDPVGVVLILVGRVADAFYDRVGRTFETTMATT